MRDGSGVSKLNETLDAEMPGLLVDHKVPGVTIALVQDGKLAGSTGYGLADKKKKTPASAQTVYQIASISKTMAAWGVMRLVEQGKIDLDAPVGQYLTRWKLPKTKFDNDAVTMRRLLSHSAGLSVHGYPGYRPEGPLPSLEEALSGKAGRAYAVKVVAEPGKAFSYSGGGYTLAQLIIEEVSGKGFADFMQDEVIDPLGLKQTSYTWREDLRPLTAKAYNPRGRRLPNYLFTELAAAGVHTTASDLAGFGAAYFSGGGILSAETIAEMTRAQIPFAQNANGMEGYGFGCMLETRPNGMHLISHFGGNRGWRSLLIFAPKERAALVALANSDNADNLIEEIYNRWESWLEAGMP